mgnify:FL=1
MLVNFPPPPPQVAPVGKQETDSAPYLVRNLIVDQPENLLGSAIGLQPIASAQSEWMQPIAAPAVYSWLAPNATIRLTSVAQAIPAGQQHTDSAPSWNAPVQSFTAPNTLPFLPVLTPIPQGQQHTDSAPYAPPRLNVDQPENLLCVVQPLPIGQQHTDSAPAWNAPVQSFTAPVIIPPVIVPIPIGRQQTDSAPPLPPQVQGYEAPNATLFIPPPGALPPGSQHTDSAPIVTNAVWARCSSSPPDTLPPGTSTPPPTVADVTGGWPIYAPRIRKKREPLIPVIEQAESVSVSELSYKAKRDIRRAKLREKQVLDALKAIYAEQDAIQNAITLEQALIAADEDVILVLLALM